MFGINWERSISCSWHLSVVSSFVMEDATCTLKLFMAPTRMGIYPKSENTAKANTNSWMYQSPSSSHLALHCVHLALHSFIIIPSPTNFNYKFSQKLYLSLSITSYSTFSQPLTRHPWNFSSSQFLLMLLWKTNEIPTSFFFSTPLLNAVRYFISFTILIHQVLIFILK